MTKGRPRRATARRHRNGSIVEGDKVPMHEDARRASSWTRYRDHADEFGMDPRLATLAGKEFWHKRLTDHQFQAATRWSEYLDQYDLLILGKRRTTKPPAFEVVSPGEGGERDPDRIEDFLQHFRAANYALLVAGKLSELAVNRLCRNEGIPIHFDDVARGLDALAAHWQLTPARKRATR